MVIVLSILFACAKSKVIFRGTFWARQWSLLLKEEDGQKVREGCLILEKRVSGFFAMKGWNLRKRLGD
ncbi:hypothetical protein DAI22_06g130200 [Oryza sativa Japonica Group]|nr:hypothetical protein DAI22_06g130200 [Oryza sativa Japonica Group]